MDEIIQSTQNNLGGSKIIQVFSLQTEFTNKQRKFTEFLRKFHTVDNDKLLIRITSCP